MKGKRDAIERDIRDIHEMHAARAVPPSGVGEYSFTWEEEGATGLQLKDGVEEGGGEAVVMFVAPDAPPELNDVRGWVVVSVGGESVEGCGAAVVEARIDAASRPVIIDFKVAAFV